MALPPMTNNMAPTPKNHIINPKSPKNDQNPQKNTKNDQKIQKMTKNTKKIQNNNKIPKKNSKNHTKIQKNTPQGIKIILWNKGSSKFQKRIPNIKLIINDQNPHIFIINEANINLKQLKETSFPDYSIETDKLIHTRGQARTIMLIHEAVNYERCHSLEDEDLSTVWIKAGFKQQRIFLINGHYRQWKLQEDKEGLSHKVSQQRIRLSRLLKPWVNLADTGMEVISVGDINLPDTDRDIINNYDRKLTPLTEEYTRSLNLSSLTKLSTDTTRMMQGHQDSSPDQIHVSDPSKTSDVTVLRQGDSDHNVLIITRYTKKQIVTPRYRLTRDYKKLDILDFNVSLLKDRRYMETITETDPNIITETLQNLIKDKLDEIIPEYKIQYSTKSKFKISQETRTLMSTRDSIRSKARLTNDTNTWRHYRHLRNLVNSQLEAETKAQNIKNLNPTTNSTSKLWENAKKISGWSKSSTPRRLIYGGKHFDKPVDIANILNQSYIDKAKSIAESIQKSKIDPLVNYSRIVEGKHLEFKLRTISMSELKLSIKKMRATNSTGFDSISMRLIKQSAAVLYRPLLNMVNSSLTTNTFPNTLKTAKIIPILKKSKDTSLAASYRPVNLLPSLSKILEFIVAVQLKEHLESNQIIPGNHSGSQRLNSTTTATMTLHDMWAQLLEANNDSVIIQLDQSSAFDIICHQTLKGKLKLLGFDEHTMQWFNSYMSNRKQSVQVEAEKSTPLEVGDRSVIQGSVLSCILYLLYILDMPSIFHTVKHTTLQDAKCRQPMTGTYVDDFNTTVTCKDETIDQINDRLEDNMKQTKKYMDANGLALNPEKTRIFVITKKPEFREGIRLKVGDKTIKHTRTLNLLGITVNDKLNWHDHISQGNKSLATQIKNRTNVLRKIVKLTNFNFAKQVANGLIMAKIEYAIQLWGTATQADIDIIQKLANRAAKVVLGHKANRWSIDKIMRNMNWLKVKELISYHQATLIHQILHTGRPEYLYDRLAVTSQGVTRSRANDKLGPWPSTTGKTIFTSNIFIARSYKIYNELPGILTIIQSKKLFKIRLRRYLMDNEDLPNLTDKYYMKLSQMAAKAPLHERLKLHRPQSPNNDSTQCQPFISP